MTTPIYWFVYGSLFRIADATVKATFLLALVAAAVLLLRRSSASIRHLVWALGLGAALVLPLSSWIPRWRVPYTVPPTYSRPLPEEVPPAQAPQPMPKVAVVGPQAVAGAVPATGPQRGARPRTAPSPVSAPARISRPADTTPATIPWATGVLLVWAGGVIFVLAQLAQGLLLVRRLARASVPITTGPLADAARAATNTMGVRQPVALRLAASAGRVSVPLTYGAWRPVVVLPADAPAWPAARIGAALLHEMAHVRRHDWALQIVAHGVRAAYWFDPLVWLAARRLRAEAEAACDDLVLGAGLSAPDYARHLLDVALGARRSQGAGWGAVAMAQNPKVEGRLRAVLAQNPRRPVTRKAAAGLLAAALLLALPLGALRLVAQGEAVPDADRLQLSGDFTLRYAATITDQTTEAEQFRQYQQLRADYTRELQKDPYFQPVPADYYAPFSYFQSRRPKTRRVVLTVSADNGRLLWRKEEDGHTEALLYDGTSGTQHFTDGHAGRVEPGLKFSGMSDCPLPGVGLPHVPLFKGATLANSAGTSQTWQALSPYLGGEIERGKVIYMQSQARMVSEAGMWKALDVDTGSQRFRFLQHQRFGGMWIASHMLFTKYQEEPVPASPGAFTSIEAIQYYIAAHRTPTSACEYRLLSANDTPLDMSASGMRAVSAAPLSRDMPASKDGDLDSLEVQEALHLRFHLQAWAMTQKTALQQLARGGSGARAAVPFLDSSLSGLPLPLWSGDPRPNHVWDGDPRVGHKGQKPLFTMIIMDNPWGGRLSTAEDFETARSDNKGSVHVALWGSGRITRGSREIVPAFYGVDGVASMAGDGPASPVHKAEQVVLGGADAQYRLAWGLYRTYEARTHRSRNKPWTFGPPAALDGAILHMQAAVAQRPGEWWWQESLGFFLTCRHRWAEAVPHLRRAREGLDASGSVHVIRRAAANGNDSQGPAYNSLYALCDSFVRGGDHKDAALHYLQSLVAAEGDAYADAGRYREAAERYREALQFDSLTSYVLFAQGDALRRAGRRAEARATWKRILSIDPPRTYYYARVRERLARR